MADLLDLAHINAGLALLRADTSLTVYPDAEGNTPNVPARPAQYVRVYTSIERFKGAEANALDGLSVSWTVRYYCHSIGPNEYSAAAVSMRVDRALLNKRPVITGRVVGLIEQEAASAPVRDETTGTLVMDLVTVYKLISLPG